MHRRIRVHETPAELEHTMRTVRRVAVTVLSNNTVQRRGLLAEHGLSFLIEADEHRVLFDTGQQGIVIHNARALGLSLNDLDAVILSHGHYDHVGGLRPLMEHTQLPRLYAHPFAFCTRYLCPKNDAARDVGPDPTIQKLLAEDDDGFQPINQPTVLLDSVGLSGPIPRRTDYEDAGGAFFLDPACTEPDTIPDDLAVYVRTPRGLIVLLGCAHAGVVNTLDHIRRLSAQEPIHAVLGGMHLLNASEQRLAATIDALRRMDIQQIAPAHCTGWQATLRLSEVFGPRCLPCPVGTRFVFGD